MVCPYGVNAKIVNDTWHCKHFALGKYADGNFIVFVYGTCTFEHKWLKLCNNNNAKR